MLQDFPEVFTYLDLMCPNNPTEFPVKFRLEMPVESRHCFGDRSVLLTARSFVLTVGLCCLRKIGLGFSTCG